MGGLFHSTKVSGAGRCFNGAKLEKRPVTSFASRAPRKVKEIYINSWISAHVMGCARKGETKRSFAKLLGFFSVLYQFQDRFLTCQLLKKEKTHLRLLEKKSDVFSF